MSQELGGPSLLPVLVSVLPGISEAVLRTPSLYYSTGTGSGAVPLGTLPKRQHSQDTGKIMGVGGNVCVGCHVVYQADKTEVGGGSGKAVSFLRPL